MPAPDMSQRSFDDVPVSELLHENSKMQPSDRRIAERIMAMSANPMMMRLASSQKRYPGAERIALSEALPAARIGFDEVVQRRRSSRDFTGEPLTLGEIAKLLFFAAGITGSAPTHDGRRQLFRATPSGGALYPTEVYLIALRVEGLEPGVYHYVGAEGLLERVREGDCTKALCAITFTEEMGRAGAAVAISGIPLKSRIKYGERAYRFLMMEAGHMAQNLLLTATALELCSVPIGGFLDDDMDRLLGIDGIDEVSLYLVAVGRGHEHEPG
jgi:SagB-type dehydrogenase family enzyme